MQVAFRHDSGQSTPPTRRRIVHFFVCTVGLLLLLVSQTGFRLPWQKAPAKSKAIDSPTQVSHFTLPVNVSLSALSRFGEDNLPKSFDVEGGQAVVGVNFSTLKLKRGSMAMRWTNDSLLLTTRLSGQCKFSSQLLSVPLGSALVQFNAGIRTRPTLTTNWTVQLNAEPYCEVESIHFEGTKVSSIPWVGDWLRARVCEEIQDNGIEPYLADIEEQMAADTSIRLQVQDQLHALADGIRVSKKPDLWLQVVPLSMHQPELSGNESTLICRVGMDAVVTTSITKPAPKRQTGLPPIVVRKGPDEFLLNGQMEGKLDDWERLLRPMIVGGEIELSGQNSALIEECRLEERGTNIAIRLQFETRGQLKMRGEMVLEGTPIYDSKRQEFFLAQAEYDLETRRRFAKAADWLLHGNIRKQVEKLARYNISQELDGFKSLLSEQTQSYPLLEGAVLEAKIEAFEVQQIRVQDRRLQLSFVLRGTGKITVSEIKLPQ